MAIMKQILMLLLAFLLSVSTCQKKAETVDEQRMIVTQDTLTKYQLDSVFRVDDLSFNIEEDWIDSAVLTEDKTDILHKYIYIKELTDSTGTVYTLWSYVDIDSLYILNKRVVE